MQVGFYFARPVKASYMIDIEEKAFGLWALRQELFGRVALQVNGAVVPLTAVNVTGLSSFLFSSLNSRSLT